MKIFNRDDENLWNMIYKNQALLLTNSGRYEYNIVKLHFYITSHRHHNIDHGIMQVRRLLLIPEQMHIKFQQRRPFICDWVSLFMSLGVRQFTEFRRRFHCTHMSHFSTLGIGILKNV